MIVYLITAIYDDLVYVLQILSHCNASGVYVTVPSSSNSVVPTEAGPIQITVNGPFSGSSFGPLPLSTNGSIRIDSC